MKCGGRILLLFCFELWNKGNLFRPIKSCEVQFDVIYDKLTIDVCQ